MGKVSAGAGRFPLRPFLCSAGAGLNGRTAGCQGGFAPSGLDEMGVCGTQGCTLGFHLLPRCGKIMEAIGLRASCGRGVMAVGLRGVAAVLWGSLRGVVAASWPVGSRRVAEVSAPKGREVKARGNALGLKSENIRSPEGAGSNAGFALSGLDEMRGGGTQGCTLGFHLLPRCGKHMGAIGLRGSCGGGVMAVGLRRIEVGSWGLVCAVLRQGHGRLICAVLRWYLPRRDKLWVVHASKGWDAEVSAPKGRDVKAQGNALGRESQNTRSPEGAGGRSVPHITFVVFDGVFLEQPSVFLLEGHDSMMLGLPGEIALQSGPMSWADGEDAVSSLPMELRQLGRFRL